MAKNYCSYHHQKSISEDIQTSSSKKLHIIPSPWSRNITYAFKISLISCIPYTPISLLIDKLSARGCLICNTVSSDHICSSIYFNTVSTPLPFWNHSNTGHPWQLTCSGSDFTWIIFSTYPFSPLCGKGCFLLEILSFPDFCDGDFPGRFAVPW